MELETDVVHKALFRLMAVLAAANLLAGVQEVSRPCIGHKVGGYKSLVGDGVQCQT